MGVDARAELRTLLATIGLPNTFGARDKAIDVLVNYRKKVGMEVFSMTLMQIDLWVNTLAGESPPIEVIRDA